MPREPDQAVKRTGIRTAAGATQILFAEALILPTGLVTAAYLTRTLGPADYGVFTLCASIASWLGWMVAAVLSRATVKLVSQHPAGVPRSSPLVAALFRVYLVSAVGTCVLLFLGADAVARGMAEPSMAGYLRLFSLEVATFGLAVFHRDLLIAMGRFAERAKASAVRWILRLVLIVGLVHAGLSIYGAILGSILASAAELIVVRYYVRPTPFVRGPLPARLLPVLAPLVGYAIAMRLLSKLDLFMLKALGGTAEAVGFYGAAQNLTIAVTLLTLAVSPTLLTHLTTLRSSGRLDEARHAASITLRFALILAPLAAAAAGASGEIVVLLFGERFASSAPLFAILLVAEVALVATSLSTALLVATDQHRRVLAIAVSMLVVAFVAHLNVIPVYGAPGAACVTAAVSCAGALAAMLIASLAWSIPVPVATVLRSIVLAVAAYAAAAVSWGSPVLVIAKLAVVAAAVVAGFFMLGEFSDREKQQLRDLLTALR